MEARVCHSRPVRVTIVIDNFNYERYVGRAIQSALAQTYPDVDVVVVDDGSTDGSADVIQRYADRVVVVSKANGGQASALNRGFEQATGDIVFFLDSDDELYPDAAETVVATFDPTVAKVHFRLDMVDQDGVSLGFTNPSAHRPLPSGCAVTSLLSTGRYVTPVMSGNAYAHWALEAVMPIPEASFRYSADGYLVSTVPFYGELRAVDRALGCYRVHGKNYWVADAVDADAVRRRIEHDLTRNGAMREHAARRGLVVSSSLEMQDRAHLCARLASFRLDPGSHPVEDEGVTRLLAHGVRATLREPGYSWPRRLRMCLWFALVALLPRRSTRPLITMMFVPQRRRVLASGNTSHAG